MTLPIPSKMQIYIEAARQRQQQRKQFLERRRQQGVALGKEAAKILRQEFEVSRVVLFGSILNETDFHESSDLDLAVWQLNSSDYIKAIARLMELPGFTIDLVEAETASPYLQAAIAQGMEL
uniref:DNA polymerase beta subunit n=1 Tax=Cyanothece sp. (strain PCC 7425 / ATCC 29141) TaxID=395961 RepID=B8HZM2_CYAP4